MSLKGLRVYTSEAGAPPIEVAPPPSPRKYWTRRGIAECLVERLAEPAPTLVGIDHGFSFPLRYLEVHRLKPDWAAFLDDFQRHWPTDEDHTYVDFVRDGTVGNGAERTGDARAAPATLGDPELVTRLAVAEAERRGLKDMVAELRQSRDDWKGQAERATLALTGPVRRPWWKPLRLAG